MQKTHLADFGRIDQTGDAASFIRFLDAACAQESFRAYKRHMIGLLGLPGPLRLLDMGCGTGDDVREMAKLVVGGGRLVGVDNSQSMIQEARQRCLGRNLPVEFHVGEALALPFAGDSFDGCQADRSLMHVPDAAKALGEMIRVTRKGGRVVVYEVDFGQDRGLARRVIDTWCDSFRDGWLGRRMAALFAKSGMTDIGVTPHTLVLTPDLALPILGSKTVEKAVEKKAITTEEGKAWLNQLERLQEEGRFFSTLTGFLVSGRKATG
jgi:ubiquinone/menaquinone biosynthesis C-methylase UbiE